VSGEETNSIEFIGRVKLRKLFTEARPGERLVRGKIVIHAQSPEGSEAIRDWKQHVGMNGGGAAISIAYFEKGPIKEPSRA